MTRYNKPTKPIRVCHVIAALPTKTSGPKFSVTLLANQINTLVLHSTVFSVLCSEQFTFQDCPVLPIKQLTLRDYHVLHFSELYGFRIILLMFKCAILGVPYIISPRGSLMPNALKRRWYKKIFYFPLLQVAFLFASYTHFLSEDERKNSLPIFTHSKTYIAPNVPPISKRLNFVEAINKGRRRLGFIGRIDIVHKSLDIILGAVHEIQDEMRFHKWTLHIAGPDFRGNREKIVKMIRDKKIGDIVYLYNEVQGYNKAIFLNATDIFLQISRFEGQPQAALEAISFGCCILASKQSNLGTFVNSKDLGLTLPNLDIAALSSSILKLIRDPCTLTAYQNNALAVSFTSLKEIGDIHKSYYERVVVSSPLDQGRGT